LSDLKVDGIISSTGTNTNLELSGKGTGGVKITDYLIQTKGDDIASATSLTLGKDGNQFDVTGTTTITSIATQGIGSYVTLHFDGALTFTHHSTNLILPGAASITTAAGDIAVMYEYASADWRCVSYTKASGAAVVAGGGGMNFVEQIIASTDATITFTHVLEIGYDYQIVCRSVNPTADIATAGDIKCEVGTGGTPTFQTSNYTSQGVKQEAGTRLGIQDLVTDAFPMQPDIAHGGAGGSTETFDALIYFFDPGAVEECVCHVQVQGTNIGATKNLLDMWCVWKTTTAVTALRVLVGEDAFETGEFALYRRKNS